MKKQILIFIILSMFSMPQLKAEENLPSCGTNCTYTIENGVLTISPIDSSKSASIQAYDRPGYSTTTNYAPWRYDSTITKVVISEGITSVGAHAFEDHSYIQEVVLPEGLKTIASESFHNMRSLTKVNLPNSLTQLSSWSFGHTGISEITIPPNLTSIAAYSFTNTNIESIVIPENITSLSPQAFFGTSSGYQGALLKNLYCEEALAAQCKEAVALFNGTNKEVKVMSYQKTIDGQLFYNGKWYSSPNDIIGDNHIKKRIYTIDEAIKVSKETGNTFKLRYK